MFTATVQMSGLTVQNGNSGSSPGGRLRNETGGALTLTNVTVVSNTTTGNGGGIYNTGALTLTSSAVLSNTALGTGGGVNNYGGTAVLTNVTASGN